MTSRPYNLTRRGSFGQNQQVPNKAGGFSYQFISSFQRWYGVRRRTMNQNYQIYGSELQDTIDIIIRHDPTVNSKFTFQTKNGTQYQIVSISPDETDGLNTFDILTLKKIEGKTNGR
ncbi:phage head closure protein [Oenococcus alcoholitolerans]|uniref:phage head closure protein n=1 Tax=Oenococcus alcoholitolerans TaxID=931074 RepID=UPI003F711D80